MQRLPVVAIVGRPNTGKSTLFNALLGERRAIVSDIPGTTRDHVAGTVETESVDFLLVDTAGINGKWVRKGDRPLGRGGQSPSGSDPSSDLEADVEQQSLLAIAHGDVIVFTLEAGGELTAADRKVVDMLRRKRKRHVPVILALTKSDRVHEEDNIIAAPFHRLGISEQIIPVSAAHMRGVGELEQAIVNELQKLHFKKNAEMPYYGVSTDERSPPRVALIGRPNVGKSSIINALMSDPDREKSGRIVSEIPGTTRDSSDTVIRFEGKKFIFVDTAGLRRPARVEHGIEGFCAMRSITALENADIVALVLEGRELVTQQDKRLAGMAIREGKGLVLLLNKWDLMRGGERTEKLLEVQTQLPFCRFIPVLPVSAKTREGLLKLFATFDIVERNRSRRIDPKTLQRWYGGVIERLPGTVLRRGTKITQAEGTPPTFELRVRNPKAVTVRELKTLERKLRESFAFEGTPIRWVTR